MMNDCQVFNDASTYIYTWLTKQPSVKEESLTDWLLYDISSKIPRIRYFQFPRHAEARNTGADWEWWFLYSDGSYRYRIQAKKTSPNGDNYPSIAYTNKHGLQIDKLISDSKAANAIPAYVFYSTSPKRTKCGRDFSAKGAFSVGAQTVYSQFIANGKLAVPESAIWKISIPLQCFTCCPLSINPNSESMNEFIDHYFAEEMKSLASESTLGTMGTRPGFHETLPSYVSSLLDYSGVVPELWHREYQSQIEDINAVFIYDLRERA